MWNWNEFAEICVYLNIQKVLIALGLSAVSAVKSIFYDRDGALVSMPNARDSVPPQSL